MELPHRLADRFRRVPKVVWGFVVISLAFGLNAAWVTRPFAGTIYLSSADLPVRARIRLGHEVHFVHTR